MIAVAPVMSASFGVLVVVILGYELTGWYDGENLEINYTRELQETNSPLGRILFLDVHIVTEHQRVC